MTQAAPSSISIAIACGGTGGHLFPGLAVADCLIRRGCKVTLLISPKAVDQQALKNVTGYEVVTLPAIGLTRGHRLAFALALLRSYRAARKHFKSIPPRAVLAMGGFTAAPPLVAGKRMGAASFLHESNTIPGRANRWLSRLVNGAFVGFPTAAEHLHNPNVIVTGTPVRRQFRSPDAAVCRQALGLDPQRPVVLVMGGSQGAHAINALLMQSLPMLAEGGRDWQWLHLTGSADLETVKAAYASANRRAAVHSFLNEMGLALGAATAAISRAGASSLAEFAALRLPAILIPYPAATDNHQYYNACAFAQSGAASILEQQQATPNALAHLLSPLMMDQAARTKMQAALAQWHTPDAAERIAASILTAIDVPCAGAAPAHQEQPARTISSNSGEQKTGLSTQLLLALRPGLGRPPADLDPGAAMPAAAPSFLKAAEAAVFES
jgi:UDP-N-acetylglucosamine--N-acetylmuramyl-(pentapeptide) pyrophosphoryl-undecaprenol N-acetylglucosamine transferase